MAQKPQTPCPQCGGAIDLGAMRCQRCGWRDPSHDGARVWRFLAALVMLVPALGLGVLGGTCVVMGAQERDSAPALQIGLAMLLVAGVIVYGAVWLVRHKPRQP